MKELLFVWVTVVSQYTPEVATPLAFDSFDACERARIHSAYATPCTRYKRHPKVIRLTEEDLND